MLYEIALLEVKGYNGPRPVTLALPESALHRQLRSRNRYSRLARGPPKEHHWSTPFAAVLTTYGGGGMRE